MHNIKPQIFKQDGKQRSGKGFSKGEVSKADLTVMDARKIGLSVDLRRGTVHDENVEAIKAYTMKAKSKPKPKTKSKRARIGKKEKAKS